MTSADTTTPMVSIGLPVFNGEAFVGEAIESLLSQSVTDLELIISDNASTDRTQEICLSWAEKDPRVRYSRNAKNLGATGNYNRVAKLARGTYFKWAAHDDLHHPDYLARCIELLENDSSIVLVFPQTKDIDEDGHELVVTGTDVNGDVFEAVTRFRNLIRLDYSCVSVFGLMRTELLRRIRPFSNYADCDRVLLAEIGLAGRIVQLPDRLFIHRQHKNRSVLQFSGRQERAGWFDPRKEGKPVYPYTREFWGFVGVVTRASLSAGQRLRCYGSMVHWAWVYRGRLWNDVEFAIRYVLRPLKRRIVGPRDGISDKKEGGSR